MNGIRRRGVGLDIDPHVLKDIVVIGILRSVMAVLGAVYRGSDERYGNSSYMIPSTAVEPFMSAIYTTICGLDTDVRKITYAPAYLTLTPRCEYRKYIRVYMSYRSKDGRANIEGERRQRVKYVNFISKL